MQLKNLKAACLMIISAATGIGNLLAQNFPATDLGPYGKVNYVNTSLHGTGQFHCFAFDPEFNTSLSRRTMYAGSIYSGLWKKSGDATQWEEVQGIKSLQLASVNCIEIAKNSRVIYVTTGSRNKGFSNFSYIPSDGVYFSNDEGVTFSALSSVNSNSGLGFNFNNGKIVTDIQVNEGSTVSSNHLYLSTNQGLYTSTNNGNTWTLTIPVVSTGTSADYDGIYKTLVNPYDPNDVYAIGDKLYHSTNKGLSFTGSAIVPFEDDIQDDMINQGYTSIEYTKINFDIAFIDPQGSSSRDRVIYYSCFVVARNSSGGKKSFHRVYGHSLTSLYQGWLPGSVNLNDAQISAGRIPIAVNPNNPAQVFFGDLKLRRSDNFLLTSQPILSSSIHDDMHALSFLPDNPLDQLLVGCDGGIELISPATTSLSLGRHNNGISASLILDMSVARTKKKNMLTGKQDTNNDMYDIDNWIQNPSGGGDGYPPVLINQLNHKKFLLQENSSRSVFSYNGEIASFSNRTGFPTANSGCVNLLTSSNSTDKAIAVFQNLNVNSGNYYFMESGRLYKDISQNSFENIGFGFDFGRELANVQGATYGGPRTIAQSNVDYEKFYVGTWGFNQWAQAGLFSFVVNNWNTACNTTLPACSNTPCLTSINYLQGSSVSSTDYWKYPLSSIVEDENNPNVLYVGIDYHKLNTSDPKLKIRKSTDNSHSNWVNYDQGLPDFPISAMCPVKGSNSGLYAGTANGLLFYRNAGMSQWVQVGAEIPHTRIVKIEINYCNSKVYVATYGRGVFELDLYNSTSRTEDLVIAQDVVWNESKEIGADIIIQEGKKLTITQNSPNVLLSPVINMCKGCEIIVEPGAELIIDNNAKLTNACGELWKGITVKGKKWGVIAQTTVNQPNLRVTPHPYHGYLRVNNAEISYMSSGILTAGADWWNSAGGMIEAIQGRFYNNVNVIWFSKFANNRANCSNMGGVQRSECLAYKSLIQDCEFKNDKVPLYQHIGLWDVHGVVMEGNTFRNDLPFTSTNSTETVYPFGTRGYGIVAYDATYVVRPSFTGNHSGNQFYNLDYGICQKNVYPTMSRSLGLKIYDNTFDNCRFGVYFQGVANFRIKENEINIAEVPLIPNNKYAVFGGYGIYLNGASSYQVQDNTITGPSVGFNNSISKSYGILVNNGHMFEETIRKNIVLNTNYATTAVGLNGSVSNMGLPSGLQFKCNTFSGQKRSDIWVTNNAGQTSGGLIRKEQGNCRSVDLAANNLFNTRLSGAYHLAINSGVQPFIYNYIPNTTYSFEPRDLNSLTIVKYPCSTLSLSSGDVPCPSIPDQDDYSIKMLIRNHQNQAKFLLSLIDGGDSEGLINLISQATASNIQQIMDSLSEIGALSDEVLLELINSYYAKDELADLVQLLIEQSGLSDSVVNSLVQQSLPFTYAEVQALIEAQNNESLKDQLVAEAAAYQSQAEELLNEYQMRLIERGASDSILQEFQTFDTLGLMRYRKAMWHAAEGNVPMMENELEYLAQEEPDWGSHLNRVKSYLQLSCSSAESNLEVYDTTYLSSIQALKGTDDMVGLWASSALYRAGVDTLYEYLPSWDSTQYRLAEKENIWSKLKWTERNEYTLWPNPANQSVSVSWKNSAIKEVRLQLHNNKGFLVKEVTVGYGSNISLEDLSNGHYIVSIIDTQTGSKHRISLVVCH